MENEKRSFSRDNLKDIEIIIIIIMFIPYSNNMYNVCAPI